MTAILGSVVLLILIFAPGIWVKHVMKKYGNELESVPGTGAQLVEYFAHKYDLAELQVEKTHLPNHYDIVKDIVRLNEQVHDKRSLTAVAIAAHEVGHAIQKSEKNFYLSMNHKIQIVVAILQKMALVLFISGPIIAFLVKSPLIVGFTSLVFIGSYLLGVVSQFLVLPTEWDASFKKALPILKETGHFDDKQLGDIKSVLSAAAFTYLAAALTNFVTIFLRRRIPGFR